jgi:hypothetical protein
VGDTVEVLENIVECNEYNDRMVKVGSIYNISYVRDNSSGVAYEIDGYVFPHYCIKKVENPPREMTQAQIEQELGYKVKIIE